MVGVITQDYFDTEQGLEDLIAGTYNAIRFKYAWTEGPYNFEMGTDIGVQSNDWNTYNTSVWSPTGAAGTQVNNLMGYTDNNGENLGGYSMINDCNRAIESIREGRAEGKFASDEAYANLRLSEALFNRAWCYHMLVTMLGDVPLKLESSNSLPSNYNFPRTTSEEIYKQLISDVRFCHEYLPDAASGPDFGRLTKGAAAHFLARLYLERAQGADFKQYRAADGSIDHSNANTHLGMLYKGAVSTDLDSCIYYANQVINGGYYSLKDDYADLFAVGFGSYPAEENNREVILWAAFGGNDSYNTRYGMRFQGYFTPTYVQSVWGLPDRTWEYGSNNTGFKPNDWAYDVFTDKLTDSRFQKSFRLEYEAGIASDKGPTDPYYPYNDPNNGTQTWGADEAAYFNNYIWPTYDRPSWGGRQAVAGEHKIGTTDLGLVFLENTKETAITLREALAQPYVLYPRWIYNESTGEYYYRRVGLDKFEATNNGLEFGYATVAASSKHIDPNRNALNGEYGTRSVAVFRLAETYLIRAEAYGRKEGAGSSNAIADINTVRMRAAYKAGENRAEVLARLYPGKENLPASERGYPYKVEQDRTNDMRIDASYWSMNDNLEQVKAEDYPPEADTELKRFLHFIYNEYSREFNSESVLYYGLHHSGLQAERIQWHNQIASTIKGKWDAADNTLSGQGQTGDGKGMFKAAYTFRPFPQTYINMLTDENNVLLDETAKANYQNPGY